MNEWKSVLWIVKLLGVLVAVFVLALVIYTFRAVGFIGVAPATNTITVSGHGEAFAVPNLATVTFGVEKTAKTVAEAQNQVTTIMNDVVATLKTNGVEGKDIQTTSYNINPHYEYQGSTCSSSGICPPSKQILTGYTVTDSVTLKIRKIDNAGVIIGMLGQKSVTNLSGLQLTVENDSAVKTEARNKAISQAKSQAESIAQGLGVRLVRITNFNESGAVRPMYYDKAIGLSATSSVAPTISVGQNTSSSDVTITYEIQ